MKNRGVVLSVFLVRAFFQVERPFLNQLLRKLQELKIIKMIAGNTFEQLELLKGLRESQKRELDSNIEKLKALQKSISSNSEAIDIANELIDETLLNIKDGKLEFRVLEENLLL